MKKSLIYLYILFSVGIFLFPKNIFAADYSVEKIFYLPAFNAVKGVDSLNKNWEKIDILAPQYHTVNANFTVSGNFGPKLRQAIKDHNIKVMPLVANAGFSQKIIHNLLTSPAGQDKVLNYLVKGALTNGYMGWQFDFENINCNDRDLYSAFVIKSYKVFKQNNLLFSVVAVPRTSDFANTNAFKNWSGVYDYKLIAENTDFVSLMAYDDPNSVGPVASLSFVSDVLAYVKDKIPPEKLSLGVPLYYWKWNADTDKKIGSGLFQNVTTIIANFQHTLSFNPSLGVSCLTYSYNNKNYDVWFENKQSLQAKIDIIKANNLRGFSAWLLGGEDPDIWSILDKNG